MALILDGNKVAASLKEDLLARVTALRLCHCEPHLVILLVGEDKPSRMYADFMKKAGAEYGLKVTVYAYEGTITEERLAHEIQRYNCDASVMGILMMMPLPSSLDGDKMSQLISPDKDVDGLTAINAGRLLTGRDGLFPCTPRAVMAILAYYGISLAGKHAVVLGRSNVVGKPVALLLLEQNATVTICHSRTENLQDITKKADILISAVGHPHAVTADMVNPGSVIVDVGINRIGGKTVGDVDYESVAAVAGAITPVPGGVGAVTTTMVAESVVRAAEKAIDRTEKGDEP